jgi:hypothetical protein
MPTVSIAGQTIEVYETLALANSYFASAFHGAPWAAAESSLRIQALVTAGSVFDRTAWQGSPTEPIDKTQPQPASTQPLAWPRLGLVDKDGVTVPSATIPLDVRNGNLEYALALVNDATVQTNASTVSNVKVQKSTQRVEGAITVATETGFFKTPSSQDTEFPHIVMDFVGFWLSSAVGPTLAFIGGTDVASCANQDWGTGNGGWP